jgi:hypothetical protein
MIVDIGDNEDVYSMRDIDVIYDYNDIVDDVIRYNDDRHEGGSVSNRKNDNRVFVEA